MIIFRNGITKKMKRRRIQFESTAKRYDGLSLENFMYSKLVTDHFRGKFRVRNEIDVVFAARRVVKVVTAAHLKAVQEKMGDLEHRLYMSSALDEVTAAVVPTELAVPVLLTGGGLTKLSTSSLNEIKRLNVLVGKAICILE